MQNHSLEPACFEHARLDRRYIKKRIFDIGGSFTLIVMLMPVMIAISICISVIAGGPIMYKHRRIGRDGIPFMCWKFRTMVEDADARLATLLKSDPQACEEWNRTQKLRNDPRIIPKIGHLLRKTSLDELPQLFNVLAGEMSLVGPRPVTDVELDEYGAAQLHYLSVRPGLTGPWQIGDRSNGDFADRVVIDRDYVDTLSFSRDLDILVRTVTVPFSQRGAY